MFKLKKSMLDRLRSDEDLQLDIAKATTRKISTIKTYARDNDEKLTSKAFVLVIKDLTGLAEEEILDKKSAALEPVTS